ncbi:MAG: thiamine pyrophosphate-dependent dehydrogenase E1 component subunit alpha, partial [Chloroflexota bacterium]
MLNENPHNAQSAPETGHRSSTDEDLLDVYRTMVLSRTLDERIWLMNRQGKAAIVASAQGHEAAQAAAVKALDPGRDHFYIYYRELTTMLALGMSPLEVLLGFVAKSGEPLSGGRQFPVHGALQEGRPDITSFSNVVGTQVSQAAGVALADKMRGERRVTVAYFGDGASSTGECHEGMNFAAIHRLPLILFCENNGYSISVPLRLQMNIESIAARAEGYGMPGVQVDGMDPSAVYEAVSIAADRALAGEGPTLIEARVERYMPHTSDDDDSRYREREELRRLREEKDPIPGVARMLRQRGLLDDSVEEEIRSEARRVVNGATEEAENRGFPEPANFYHEVYADGPV